MIICLYFTWVLSGTVDAGIQHIFTSRHEGFNIHLPKNSHRYVSAHILCIHVQVFHVNCSWEFFPLTLVFKVIPSSSTEKNSVNNVVSHPPGFMGRYERDEYSHTGGCKSLIKIKIAKLQYRKNSTVCKHHALKTSLKRHHVEFLTTSSASSCFVVSRKHTSTSPVAGIKCRT